MEGTPKIKQYLIPRGFHYSIGSKFGFHTGLTSYYYAFVLKDNCWYEQQAVTGINKICGFTEGGLFNRIHRSSIRLGWQPCYEEKDYLYIYAYWYNNSSIYNSLFLAKVKVNDYCHGYIQHVANNKTLIKLKSSGKLYFTAIDYNIPKNKWGRYCYPYHGGKSVAPNNEIVLVRQYESPINLNFII
jgi:hypothetical protein